MADLEATIVQAQKGDVVAVMVKGHLTFELAEWLKAKVSDALRAAGKDIPVLVLDGGLDIKVIKTSQLATVAKCSDTSSDPITDAFMNGDGQEWKGGLLG